MKIHRGTMFILGLAVLVASCRDESADSAGVEAGPIVARVGDREVTLSYFEDRLAKMERRFLPDTLDTAGKTEFLNFIINKELMALKAEALGYAEDDQVRGGLESMRQGLVLQAAIDQVTTGLDSVPEEEVRAFYENKKVTRLSKHIMHATEQKAEETYTALQNGADFDSLVDQNSIAPRFDQSGQQLPLAQRSMFGWVEFGQANPAVEDAIYGGPMNQASEPVETPYGWHVFYPISTRSNKQKPYEEVKPLIQRQVVGRRQRAATEAYYEAVLTDRGFELDRYALDLMYSKLPEDTQEVPDVNFEVKPVIPFTYEERETTLFELDGKEYSLGDFSDIYDVTGFMQRPKRFNGTMGIRRWIRDEWLKDLKLERAVADGFADSPEIANELKMRREEMMVGTLHTNLIALQLPEPTEEEMRAYFAEHGDHYVDREKRTCNLIYHPRERVVRRAYTEVRDGADFVQTAIRYNDSAVDPEDVQTAAFTRNDEKHADIAEEAFRLGLNEYGEPFKVSSPENSGWILLQVNQIIPEKPFEYEDVEEFVRRDWQNEWSESRLSELLEEWKQDFEVQVFEEVLATAAVRRDDVVVPSASAQPASQESGAGDTN